jgi:hypothetical protein
MKKFVIVTCLLLATSPLALGRETGPVDEKRVAPAVEASTKDAQRWAAVQKWCCRFTTLWGAKKNVTLPTGVLAVSACWSAALRVVPAVKNLSVSKGAC